MLTGGGGSDTLTGGAGADLFRCASLADSPVGGADLITDFSQADGDKIDLSSLYAQSGATFSFIGTGSFSGTPGEVQAVAGNDGNTHVYADLSGSGSANLEIVVRGAVPLTAGDFNH